MAAHGAEESSTPRLRDESIPWLIALGLGRDIERWRRRNQSAETRFAPVSSFTGTSPREEDEAWGGALMTGRRGAAP